jgi:hypothetical protein
MSGVAIINHMISNYAPIGFVVAERVFNGVVPINSVLPAISIRQISGKEFETIRRTGTQLVTERIQVSALAATYLQQKQIIELIRFAVISTRGTVNSFQVDSITPDMDGPDLYYEEPVIYEQSIDYKVRFYR